MIYISIFLSKILENTLATLRIILVSNGKKKLGAILQGIVALIWILVAGIVIKDVSSDIFKIIAFCLGSLVGSYLGSLIEEKLAIGTNMILASINTNILNKLSKYNVTIINQGKFNTTIMIVCPRKMTIHINNLIHKYDKSAVISNQRTKIF